MKVRVDIISTETYAHCSVAGTGDYATRVPVTGSEVRTIKNKLTITLQYQIRDTCRWVCMRNGVTLKLKLTLTLVLTLTDTESAVLTLMLGYRSLYIIWQQHHNFRIVCELSLRTLICILPQITLCHTIYSSLLLSLFSLQIHLR